MENGNPSRDAAQPEPLSPELALVDPETARRARERMQGVEEGAPTQPVAADGGGDDGLRRLHDGHRPAETSGTSEPSIRDRLLAAGADRGALTTSAEADGAESDLDSLYVEDDARVRRPSRLRAIFATLAGVVCVAAVAVASLFLVGRLAPTEGGSEEASSAIGATKAPKRTTPSTEKTASTPRRRAGSGKARQAAKERRKAPDRAPQTRTFVWPAVRAATSYRVEFFRRGRKIFQASPRKPRLELPRRWSYKGRRFLLTAGKYRWRVRPTFGRSSTRLGNPITSSTWVVR